MLWFRHKNMQFNRVLLILNMVGSRYFGLDITMLFWPLDALHREGKKYTSRTENTPSNLFNESAFPCVSSYTCRSSAAVATHLLRGSVPAIYIKFSTRFSLHERFFPPRPLIFFVCHFLRACFYEPHCPGVSPCLLTKIFTVSRVSMVSSTRALPFRACVS